MHDSVYVVVVVVGPQTLSTLDFDPLSGSQRSLYAQSSRAQAEYNKILHLEFILMHTPRAKNKHELAHLAADAADADAAAVNLI